VINLISLLIYVTCLVENLPNFECFKECNNVEILNLKINGQLIICVIVYMYFTLIVLVTSTYINSILFHIQNLNFNQ
jgi:hypothetical protein